MGWRRNSRRRGSEGSEGLKNGAWLLDLWQRETGSQGGHGVGEPRTIRAAMMTSELPPSRRRRGQSQSRRRGTCEAEGTSGAGIRAARQRSDDSDRRGERRAIDGST